MRSVNMLEESYGDTGRDPREALRVPEKSHRRSGHEHHERESPEQFQHFMGVVHGD